MRTCPECHSLVPVPLDACPARRDPCPILAEAADEGASEAVTEPELDLSSLDPHRTARIDRGDIEAVLAASGLTLDRRAPQGSLPQSAPAARSAANRTPARAPAARNHAALLARRLAYWSILPLFPIGFTAAGLALVGLSRSKRFPDDSETGKAWLALITGLAFGSAWLVVTLWLAAEGL